MDICRIEKCTGCFACVNVCPNRAIVMNENEKGFFFPIIKGDSCVHCRLCIKSCPVNNTPIAFDPKSVYAAFDKNDNDRAKSTSGGIFALLAKQVINNGGYVYGAALDENMVVRHIEIHSINDLDQLRNSKYVQSEIGYCYQKAKQRLEEKKQVLFSGTPCQIAGLRNYLNKNYQNLVTIDILCHGVPSPGLFRRYVASEEKIANAKMTNMLFRSKVIGWKKIFSVRMFENGKTANWGDTFVPGFLDNLYLRDSCYTCQYASDRRQGDITLGDYWGYKESAPDYIEDDDKGISLVILNTAKGIAFFSKIRSSIAYTSRTIEDAKKGNIVLSQPEKKSVNYEAFWEDAQTMNWDELKIKYLKEQDESDWMDQELRLYYDIPYKKRHLHHVFHVRKNMILKKLRLR